MRPKANYAARNPKINNVRHFILIKSALENKGSLIYGIFFCVAFFFVVVAILLGDLVLIICQMSSVTCQVSAIVCHRYK